MAAASDVGAIGALVRSYIDHKRRLGFAMAGQEKRLARFAGFADREHPGEPLGAGLAMAWVAAAAPDGGVHAARHYEDVRTFSRYACAVDERSAMLPKGPRSHARTEPYIYTDREVSYLMSSLRGIYSPDGLRALSAPAMCGLMVSCGLRPQECSALDVSDWDASAATLAVRASKFGRSRVVPVSPSVAEALSAQAAALPDASPSAPLFPTTGGRRFDVRALDYAWQTVRDGLLPEGEPAWGRRPPRPYDCRHTFATRTLERWAAEGRDVDAMMPYLSSYMGHAKLADTYWYLSATAGLLGSASEAFRAYAAGGD